MKKSVFLIAFLLMGFFGFAQNERPYVIKYKTQGDTISLRTHSVGSIHIDANGQELIHENGTEWSLLTDLDTVYIYRGSQIVNPMYVPIDWDNASLLSSNDSIGDYQIQFNGEIPELQPGSIITIDQDTIVHHIFIETVNFDGNTVNVTSVEANLSDIFADTDFTLTTVEGKSSVQGNVFYPVAAYQLNNNGVYQPLDLNAPRGGGWGFTHDLWQYGANFDGEELFSGNHYTVYMERMNFNFDIDLEMYMNFSGRDVHEIVGDAIDRWRSRALNVNAALLGTFDTEQRIRCDVEGSFNYSPGYDIWKPNLFRPVRVRFVVYGVPVVITLNADLYREVELSGNGEISAYTGFTDNADGHMGFEWRQSSGMDPVSGFSNAFEFTPPTLEGRGTIQGQVWAFPRVRLLLYDVLGPSFDFRPYLSVTVNGGFFEEMLGQTNDFCAWSLDCNTGLDLACGLSLQFMGYEVQNYSTPDWNFIDRMLYHSPKRIQKVALTGSGQTKTATFNVFDQNYLFNTEVITPLPQFVKFEADGELSLEYGIAQGGQVTVDWTPTSGDILYAKLYNVDGNVMAWDTIHAPTELPSVTTYEVTNITTNYAVASGEVTDEGGGTVSERGICLDTEHNPSIEGNHVANGSGLGYFMVSMSNLAEGTTYYVRAYATNEAGTEYGDEVSFTTLTEPSVITAPVTNITQTTATGGGIVTEDGGSAVTARGICWSTSHNPTVSGNHTSSGSGTGAFTVNMTGLTPNTTYYVRAYATNSVRTSYGEEVSFTTQQQEPTGDWVDLGLPSGLLWATRNVGASSPEDYGDYFAWAETQPKSYYDWSTYSYTCNDDYDGLTKYCTDSDYGCNGYFDNLTILQPGDDAATANWGGGARMPTKEEWQELYNNCTSVYTTQNGVNGRRFTGPNGNSLFLPAAGYRWNVELSNAGYGGDYWSSSLNTDDPYYAWGVYFDSGWAYVYGSMRYYGRSVRAVREN